MHATGKKEARQESDTPFFETENVSVLISSFKLKKRGKIPRSYEYKSVSTSCPEKMSSTQLKTLCTDPLSRMDVNGSTARKFVGRGTLSTGHNKKMSKRRDSSQQGRSFPIFFLKGSDKNVDVTNATRKYKKKKKIRKRKHKVEPNEPSRLQRRSRYLLIKMKLEQNLIDAYSAEGWKGQSREKIKPEKELIRAKKQILKCKLGLREVIRQLDSLSTIGCIEDSVMAPDGSVSHEHIFCAKCRLNEVFPDNDIVLCDGRCNCAFHQKCLDPPLQTENIPPGDQGWLCKFCDSRIEIIEAINAHLGTDFSLNSNWEDIFKEEASYPDGENLSLNPEENWPSDDSEDDDYDPLRRENISGAGTNDDASTSSSSGWPSDGEVFSEGSSCGSEDMNLINLSIYGNFDSEEASEGEILSGGRQRKAVDYKKLHDEMFGKDAPATEQLSEDEDWGPHKKRRKEKESDAASTLITLCKSDTRGKIVDTTEMKGKDSQDLQIRKSTFRMPSFAVEKLRQAFAENELPSRIIREKLSKELGLEFGKVNKWFKNTRYLALKSRKAETLEKLGNSSPNFPGKPTSNVIRDKHVNPAAVKAISSKTMLCTLKNMKEALHHHQKKKAMLTGCRLKKSRQKRAPLSPCRFFKGSDDVSLKTLLKAKRRSNLVSNDASQLAEVELERVCRAKDKVEMMKRSLTRLQETKATKLSRIQTAEQCVVFVPVAELKEKF